MEAIFQTKKVKPAVKNIFLPFLGLLCNVMLFKAINKGTKPTNRSGANHICGGQANHIKNALRRAKR